MKALEDAFSFGGFRRVILPGVVLAAGAHPLLKLALPFIHNMYGVDNSALLVIEVIMFGLLLSSGVQWVYYVYEGFRKTALTELSRRRSVRRVAKLNLDLSQLQAGRSIDKLTEDEQNRAREIYEQLLDFPLRMNGAKPERFAERPTQLGNVIATYELYAKSRYGIDSIQFWNHLLSLAPSEARKDFAEQYGFAESLVLTSFSGIVIAVLHAIVLGAHFISRYVPATQGLGPPTQSAILFAAGLLIWIGFYKAAVSAHREVSATMRSLIDLAYPAFVEWTLKMKTAESDFDPHWCKKLSAWLKDMRV